MTKVRANFYVEVLCNCPYCNYQFDILDKVRDVLSDDNRASDIEVEIICKECEGEFLVTDVDF